jgi:protein-S-isoprenylcysteine O-methyltransferase Ste14
MRKQTAALGSAAFLVVAPGTVAGLVPWLLTRWDSGDPAGHWVWARGVGGVLIAVGTLALLDAFARFAREGRGTPMPAAAPEDLVVTGLYRYVRNPMYVAILAIILGQSLLLWRPVLLAYAVLVWAVPAAFVRWYEEPSLTRRFGAQYEAYKRAVPAWWPRLRPWRPTHGTGR